METDNKNFTPKSIAALLDGEHHFVIPSFQRGYRWEEKQVRDLLEDIKQFADNGTVAGDSYFLQPIVVKAGKDGKWEVLDGQQRLTTMLLLLIELLRGGYTMPKDKERYEEKLYTICYNNRPQLDFTDLNPADNIDSFYLFEAANTIKKWCNGVEKFSDIIESLFYPTNKRQVKIIWYAIDEGNEELASIKIFNRLNKGKISLTSSELIKALFIMDYDKQPKESGLSSEQLSMEWNEMERQFQNDKFWYFISDDNSGFQTRIDVLFDFVTGRNKSQDSDFSYRKFQKLYDFCNSQERDDKKTSTWPKDICSMEDAWRQVRKTFDRMVAWYEDNRFYHYVGYLVAIGFSPLEVYNFLEEEKMNKGKEESDYEWTIDDTEKALRKKIMERFKKKTDYLIKEEIDNLEYGSEYIVRILLLFNVESCRRGNNIRFAFDKYKTGSWDVEHVNPQNDATLQGYEERKDWLKIIKDILGYEKEKTPLSIDLAKECEALITEFTANEKVDANKYKNFYHEINDYFSESVNKSDSTNENKDNISNLTLLDSATNRSYKDAPFAYKRQCIIELDRNGERFIPMCTRNLFLKYYTDSKEQASYVENMRWCEADRKCYLEAIHEAVDSVFDSVIVNANIKGGNK